MDKRDMMSCVVWLFISAFVFMASLRLGIGAFQSPGPGFLLFWASLFLAFFTFILLGIRLFKKEDSASLADLWKDRHWGNNIIVIAALLIYCLALPKLGYILATLGLMLILFSLGKMKLWAVILGSLLSVLLSYGLFFYGLKTPLPRGILAF
jgi:hypothetical protein